MIPCRRVTDPHHVMAYELEQIRLRSNSHPSPVLERSHPNHKVVHDLFRTAARDIPFTSEQKKMIEALYQLYEQHLESGDRMAIIPEGHPSYR